MPTKVQSIPPPLFFIEIYEESNVFCVFQCIFTGEAHILNVHFRPVFTLTGLKKNVLVEVPGNPFKSDILKATDLLGNTDPRKTR